MNTIVTALLGRIPELSGTLLTNNLVAPMRVTYDVRGLKIQRSRRKQERCTSYFSVLAMYSGIGHSPKYAGNRVREALPVPPPSRGTLALAHRDPMG